MVSKSTATLAGFTLNTSAGISWVLRTGFQPHIGTFQVMAGQADELLEEAGKPVELKITGGGHEVTIGGLYVIGEGVTTDPWWRTVLVADRRIWWERSHVKRRFNIRRRTGERRMLDEDGATPLEVAPVVDDVSYAPWSLKGDGEPWTAGEMVRRVLDDVEPDNYDVPPFTHARRVRDHVEIDDTGGAALQRVCAFLPGVEPYVDRTGKVRLINVQDFYAAAEAIEDLPPAKVGRGQLRPVNLQSQRPSAVVVYFDVEQEVRFDSLADGDTVTEDMRYMDNVVQVPDATLTLQDGRVVVRGTWITFDEAIWAWNNDKDGADVPDLSHAKIRESWRMGLLERVWGSLGNSAPTVSWINRISAIRAHYRQTYRINHRWMSRIHSLRPYRVSLLDTENAAFAPSVPYMGYALHVSDKGIQAGAHLGHFFFNVDGSVTASQPLSDGEPAPATVDVVDGEIGIIRINPTGDYAGNYGEFWPSAISGVPTASLTEKARLPILIDGSRLGRSGPVLTMTDIHRMSTVLTVTPGSPNSTRQLHDEIVSAIDVKEEVDQGVTGAIAESNGPVWYLRVGGGVATARYAWSHAKRSEIEESFGIGVREDDDGGDREKLKELVQNPTELRELAVMVAAGLYSSMADHYVGQMRTRLVPDLEPVGNIASVAHGLSPSGEVHTTVTCPERVKGVDGMELLPTSVRRVFMRQVQP